MYRSHLIYGDFLGIYSRYVVHLARVLLKGVGAFPDIGEFSVLFLFGVYVSCCVLVGFPDFVLSLDI